MRYEQSAPDFCKRRVAPAKSGLLRLRWPLSLSAEPIHWKILIFSVLSFSLQTKQPRGFFPRCRPIHSVICVYLVRSPSTRTRPGRPNLEFSAEAGFQAEDGHSRRPAVNRVLPDGDDNAGFPRAAKQRFGSMGLIVCMSEPLRIRTSLS
jgi:hypothetical protein